MICVTSVFPTAANLKVQILAEGSKFFSSMGVFACFHRRTGSLATIIVLQVFC